MFSFAVYPKENGTPYLPRIKQKREGKGTHRQFFLSGALIVLNTHCGCGSLPG